MASWNLRWLVDPGSVQGRGKKTALLRKLRGAVVVCVQETHWREIDAGVWSGLFPGTAVVASPARAGPNGGPQGGVAILVPAPHTLLRWEEFVPGCGLAAWVRTDEGREVMVLSIYLPPDDRVNVLRALQENFPSTSNCPVFLAGDVNFQSDAPRSALERELASTLNTWLMELDLLALVDFPTHANDGRLTCLDLLAVPAADAPLWGAKPQWLLSMSDHA
jgi:hypothetical protein